MSTHDVLAAQKHLGPGGPLLPYPGALGTPGTNKEVVSSGTFLQTVVTKMNVTYLMPVAVQCLLLLPLGPTNTKQIIYVYHK